MTNQHAVAALLQECKRALDTLLSARAGAGQGDEREYWRCRALLPEDLKTLLEEAKEMKWPFVPEKWQYKQDLGPEDKTNLQDMISVRLCDLLAYLKASIMMKDCVTAAAIVFLIDRFLYWIDASSKLLQIAKGLHRLQPTTPIGPQVLIRQARLSVNSGKLLKAEYILSSLINDNGATGTWRYAQESDRILVQSVCLQIRGQILQKLGMWYEAAELIWASVVGYFQLPQPDKKGIATSLGILADIFASMDDKDYERFKASAQIDLSLLREFSHRLLSAAEACKLAAAYSQYTPLFVLTAVGAVALLRARCGVMDGKQLRGVFQSPPGNAASPATTAAFQRKKSKVISSRKCSSKLLELMGALNWNIRGVCLLSYSHSKDCPPEKRNFYLSEAKESFEIGLLTKDDSSPITSKQELHSFIKAAFCLATVHRWLYGESEELSEVNGLCREAMGKLHLYSTPSAEEEEKGTLAREIMSLIALVKGRLRVGSFPNSDARSYVPDSYKGMVEHPVLRGEASFEEILAMHSQHHLSVCEVFENTCRVHQTTSGETQVGACITTLRTETKAVDTVCTTEETACQKKGVGKMLNPPTAGGSSERLRGQRNKYSRSDAMKSSLDEEIEPLEVSGASSAFSRWGNRSQTTTSESSWCKLSKSSYSSSWEELNPNSSQDSPREGQQQDRDSAEMQCCTTESDENSPAAFLCSLPPRAHSSSPQEPQPNRWASPQPSLEGDTHRARRLGDNTSLCGEEPQEGNSPSEKKAGEVNNTVSSLSTPSSVPKRPEEEEKSSSWEELGCRTKDSGGSGSGGSWPRSRSVWVRAEREAAESTEDPFLETRPPTNEAAPVLPLSAELRSDSSVRAWLRSCATVGNGPLQGPAVDAQAETVDDTEFELISIGDSVKNHPAASVPKHQWTPGVPTASPSGGKLTATEHFSCATTEEDEEKSQDGVSSKKQSSSSLSSWYKPAQTPRSSPEVSLLNPREGGFVFVPGRTREEILEARLLSDDDYTQLLAGVEHNWLVQRLMPTGVFKSKQLHKAYSALLLKYSKKSGLWTAQETAVFIGDYLNVAKEGKQRSAFWIHFLHQEESLGRYVGKEYKEEKGLLDHFSDVERQMTAQYYVTEFNKRLYEQKVPTQIFYIPSAVLLILEDRTIKGCVSVEPYILGEFVKLSNNTKVVKNEYKATEYGLAYGHFSYEFSRGTDVVVDLQGWVTGNGKGLIYLTDPQIHSLNSRDVSRSNFGKKGIYYFFNNQHMECNDICRRLSLTRPSAELLV